MVTDARATGIMFSSHHKPLNPLLSSEGNGMAPQCGQAVGDVLDYEPIFLFELLSRHSVLVLAQLSASCVCIVVAGEVSKFVARAQ